MRPKRTARSRLASRNGAITRSEFLKALRMMHANFVSRREFLDALRSMRTDFLSRFEAMDKRFEALHDWVTLVVGNLQTRAGKNLEETVAGALRLALSMYDIQPDQVKLRQRITDPEGRIGPSGRAYEIDILARDGETYLFEVKSTPDAEDILRFNDKAELAAEQLKPVKYKKVLVTLAKDSEISQRCQELGLLLV